MDTRTHWEKLYESKAANQVSWFSPHLQTSIALIERAAGNRAASIIDVGAGASTLADDLIAAGSHNLTVLDILGIPAKPNAKSGMNPNGIPG